VRAITRTDAQGKPVTEYFIPKNGADVNTWNRSSNTSDPQHPQPPIEWVRITPPSDDQRIVTVEATELSQGKQPTTIQSTINISGAEQHTHKRYNANSARYQDHTNPIFTEYQQLKGDTPRVLSGSNLRNEIGMAMFNSSLGFVPNNAPLPGTPEAELLRQGKWQGDLFNGTTLPEADKSLSPEQQQQRREQYQRQQQTISTVEAKIKEVGGENAKVTTLPITVDVTDAKTILQLPLFRVTGKDGKDRFVDENGRLYQDMADWKANNKLPPGRVSYFADGRINDAKDQKPNIITENTHAVIDTTGERVKSVADTVLPWLGFAAGAVLIATGLGAPIGAGLITAATVTMAGVGAYGLSQGIGNYNDRASHGQSTTDLSDAEVRGMWLGMTADALSMFAVGSALRLGKGGLSVVDDVGRVGKALSIGAQYADTAAIADTTVTLAQNWDRLTPQQQLASIGQLGFWGVSTGVSAKQAGGFENLYGAKSIREMFGGRGQGPDAPTTAPENRVPSKPLTPEEIQHSLQQYTPEQLQQRSQQLVAQVSAPGRPVNANLNPDLGNGISIKTLKNKLGGIKDINVEYGPNVREGDLAEHFARVNAYQQYRGIPGTVLAVREHLQSWVSRNGQPRPGSVAAEAARDIDKLNTLIGLRQKALEGGGLNDTTAYELKVEIAGLQAQINQNQRILARMDRSPEFGSVDSKSVDYSNAYINQHRDALREFLNNPANQKDPGLQNILRELNVTGKDGKLDIDASIDKFLENYHFYQDPDKVLRIRRIQEQEGVPQLELRHRGGDWEFKKNSDSPDLFAAYQRGADGKPRADTTSLSDKDYFKRMGERGQTRESYAAIEQRRSAAIERQAKLKQQGKIEAANQLQAQINRDSELIGMQRSEQAVLGQYPNAEFIYGKPGVPGQSGDFDLVARVPGQNGQPDRYIVVESKGGSSDLGSRMVNGVDDQGKPKELRAQQGSREYFDKINDLMSNSPNATTKGVGRDLKDAIDDRSVEYWHVSTPINGGKTGTTNIQYFDMKYRQ
jgi:hypothetical protein